MSWVEPEVASHLPPAVQPSERTRAPIARHAHVLAVDEAPAVQRRLLHGGDQELAVRADGRAEMRALPFELSGVALRVRKPERDAVVVGDREPKALRRERQSADGRGRLERCARARPCRSARRPACRPTRRPRRPARARHDRSSGAWRRSRRACSRRSRRSPTTLPSSPPVTTRSPSRGRRRGCRRRARQRCAPRLRASRTAAPPRRARTPRCGRGNARRRPARRPRPAACARRRRGCRCGVGHSLSAVIPGHSASRRA